jgi:hypothetical protein
MPYRDEKFKQAREYVRRGLFDDAELILKNMGDDPKAKAWIKRLQRYRAGDLPGTDLYSPPQSFLGVPRIQITVILWCMLLSAILLVFLIVPQIGIQNAPILLLGLLVGYGAILFFQWIYYRLFWWILVVGWIVITTVLFWMLLTGTRFIISN